MTTALAIPSSNLVRERLIERDKRLINDTTIQLQAVQAQGGWDTYTYRNIITLAKERLKALQLGLLPVGLGGRYTHLRTLLNTGQYVPPAILEKSEEVKERLPGASQRVYGWEENETTAIRRRRDPILTAYYGGEEFFLGFWLEIVVPDNSVPEFFGMTAPLLEKRGRGRPRKHLT